MTNQEAFEKVVRHLTKQGRRSERDDGLCMYRHPDGLQCAVGCLISDDEYESWMEHNGVEKLLAGARSRGIVIRSLSGLDSGLLAQLQIVHDKHSVSEWPRLLAAIANEHGLTMPEVA